MKYLAFDLEIAAIIPEGETDWKAYRPLGVTCAATLLQRNEEPSELPGGGEPSVWFGYGNGIELNIAPRMAKYEVCQLVDYLAAQVADGYTILTWNGLSFDFDVLAEESGMHAECAELAMNHVDMMYHVFCIRGHYLGLDKVAKGLGLPGKTAGMDGAQAPQMWADGKFAEVLEYVAQDVRTTMAVALEAERIGGVQWVSATGRTNVIDLDRWMPVNEALTLPHPDTSWMKNPVSREKFTAWMHA
jgi:hypothetical protein